MFALGLLASCTALTFHARLDAAARAGRPAMSAAVPFTPNPPRDGGVISEPAAQWAMANMLCADVEVNTVDLKASISTVYMRPQRSEASGSGKPVVLFLHGADFSCLEWRFLLKPLCDEGIDCAALDWYSGGWTERAQITEALRAGKSQPWTLVREHIYAFWQQQLGGRPIVLVGASLGGAVAIDFASTHPDAVEKLVLIDAGGESFKAPPPDTVSRFALPVLSIKSFIQGIQARVPNDQSRIVSLHRGQPGCYDASLEYLKSGSMARRVGPERIRMVPQPTLVIWGTDDDILPLSDAYAFERDLQSCVGVREVPAAGHSPHLEQPDAVLAPLQEFILG